MKQNARRTDRHIASTSKFLSPTKSNHCMSQAPLNTKAKKDYTTPSTQHSSKSRKITLKVESNGIVRCLNEDYEKKAKRVPKAASRGNVMAQRAPKLAQKTTKECARGLGRPLNFIDRIPSKYTKQRITSSSRNNKVQQKGNKSSLAIAPKLDHHLGSRKGERPLVSASNGRFEEKNTAVQRLATSASFCAESKPAANKSSPEDVRSKYPCGCGSDSNLSCCKRAAKWVQVSHRGLYQPEKYKKLYFVQREHNA